MNLRRWVNNRLHEIIGLSSNQTVDFIIDEVSSCTSKEQFLVKLKNIYGGKVTDDMRLFVKDLWDKVPHVNLQKKLEKENRKRHLKKVKERIELSKDYGLVESDSEEERLKKKRKKMKKKKKKKEARKREKEEAKRREKDNKKMQRRQKRKREESESSSEEEEEVRFLRREERAETRPKKKRKLEPELNDEEKLERERIKDLEEREEFEKRLLKRDEEENYKKFLSRLTPEEKADLEENMKRNGYGGMTTEQRESAMERAFEISRRGYLKKRKDDKLEILERQVQTERELFDWNELSKQEKADLEYQELIIKHMKELDKLHKKTEKRYFMPDSSEVKVRNKDVDQLINRNRQEEEDGDLGFYTRQSDWEAQKLDSIKSQIRGAERKQGDYELVLEDEEEKIAFEIMAGFDPEEEVKEEVNKDNKVMLREKKKMTLQEQRANLPIAKFRDQIIEAVKEFQVLIVVAETGSGKTTQIPQYLVEEGFAENGLRIAVTQPRRVAAMSVANRVAEEMGVRLGNEVGYTIRFEDCSSPDTKLKYLTDGMLLKEFITNPDLKRYSAIMIDEAHERTLHTDILFSLVKDLARERVDDLKIIISSATLDAEKFSDFFDDAPIFSVPGRTHKVVVYHTKNPESDYIQAALVTIMQIHATQVNTDPLGDILVFLNGQNEIEAMADYLEEKVKALGKKIKELLVLPIYANLPSNLQARIFDTTPPNARKVVLATNIAETSLTIPGIVYVIDPGFHKQNTYHPKTGMSSLLVTPISQAAAEQRKGRAGRITDGKCFRLYTLNAFLHEMEPNPTPEIQRTNLGSIVLMMKTIGLDDPVNFDFMDPPPAVTLQTALEHLYRLNALNHKGELTKLGRKMAEFPLDPQLAKAMVESEKYKCSEQILTIAACLNANANIFYRPSKNKKAADTQHRTFWKDIGDHFTLLNVYEQWEHNEKSNSWCNDCFLNPKALVRANDVRDQLEILLERVEIEKTSNSDDIAVRKALLSGFFYNTAQLDRTGGYKTTKNRQPVELYPGSCLFNAEEPDKHPKMIMFHELVLTAKEYMRTCTAVENKWLLEVAPHFFSSSILTEQSDSRKPRMRKHKKQDVIQ